MRIVALSTRGWLVIAVTIASVFAGGSIWAGVSIFSAVRELETKIIEVQIIEPADILTEDMADIDELNFVLQGALSKLQTASTAIQWAERLSSVCPWIPFLSQEIGGTAAQIHRMQSDARVVVQFVQSISNSGSLFGESQELLLVTDSSIDVGALNVRLAEIQDQMSSLAQSVEDIRSRRHAFTILSKSPYFSERLVVLDKVEIELGERIELSISLLSIVEEMFLLAEQVNPLLLYFRSDTELFERWTVNQLREELLDVDDRTQVIRHKIDKLTKDLESHPEYGGIEHNLDTLDAILLAINAVSRAGRIGLNIVSFHLMNEIEQNNGYLSGGASLFRLFDDLKENELEITETVSSLRLSEKTMSLVSDNVASPGLVTGIAGILDLLVELREGLDFANDIAPIGMEIIGKNGIRRYMILGQSADELRATGGFVSSIWIATFDSGRLSDVRYYDTVRVDDWDNLELYPPAPPDLEEHMNAWVWLMRDISWEPDFPTVARIAEDMFWLGQREKIDGVFAINQWVLLDIVDALGGVEIPGSQDRVTKKNALSVLEQETDRHGRSYTDLVFQSVLNKIDSQISTMPEIIRLASALNVLLEQSDILLYFNDPASQHTVMQQEWGGRIRRTAGDYLYVVDSNVGWTKSDRNIQRDISYTVDLTRTHQPKATLELGYRNHSSPDSHSCEPQWFYRDSDYVNLKNACYWNLLRIYMPFGATLLTHTPLPLPSQSVSVEIGRGVAGQESGALTSSYGKTVFSALMPLEAGEERQVILVYDLPASIVEISGKRLLYTLILQKQPGVRNRKIEVDMILPKGYNIRSSSHIGTDLGQSVVRFSMDLKQHAMLSLELEDDSNEIP